MAKGSPNSYSSILSPFLRKDSSDPEHRSGGIRICKNLALLAIVLQEDVRSYLQQTFELLAKLLGTRLEDTSQEVGPLCQGIAEEAIAGGLKDYAYHKEKMIDVSKQAEQGVPLKWQRLIG
ncbi:hypothetical protein Tco_0629037 [Tanacetum coccineum]|uniref:Uncharacterized protein n=1 Tax=Tanacetum coccineum TaxID=301880 RepID=A0ABQ4WRZ1_9ASTR